MDHPTHSHKAFLAVVTFAVAALLAAQIAHAQDQSGVSVFNFEMTDGHSDWDWLEKGLADMITHDLIASHLPVIAREEMQSIAMITQWKAEEMMRKAYGWPMAEIKKSLKIELLVSGTYQIDLATQQVKIDTQIVHLDQGEVLQAFHHTSDLSDVLALRKQLSSEIAAFLVKQSDSGNLPNLESYRPVPWSESVDSLKAFYEGIDLFDRGIYSEAWLKFRQARGSTSDFADALYWQGRMEYFSDRYQHARLTFEDFLATHSTHPSADGAVKEYIHTFERFTRAPNELSELYHNIRQVAPDAKHRLRNATLTTEELTAWKMGRIFGEQGDYHKALEHLNGRTITNGRSLGDQWSRIYAKRSTESAHTWPKTVDLPWGDVMEFTEESPELAVNYRRPRRWGSYHLIPPSGKLFKTLRVWIDAPNGYNTVYQLNIQQVKRSDVYVTSSQYPQYHKFPEDGYLVPSLPNVPFVEMSILCYDGMQPLDKNTTYSGIRVLAEYRDIPKESGKVEIICDNSDDFRVFSGDQMLRSGNGTIAFLEPGRHTLRFLPHSRAYLSQFRQLCAEIPYADFEVEVEVKAGQTTPCKVSFPWKDPVRFQDWQVAEVHAATPAPLLVDLESTNPDHRPQILMEDDRIRLLWSEGGDIWTCESLDGKTFTNRRHLALPVSTAWEENRPRCRIDHQGRYVLAFRSDRNKDRVQRLYMTWSRDFINWTAPKQVRERYVEDYDFINDPISGRLVLAEAADAEVSLWQPDDYFQFHQIGEFSFQYPVVHLQLLPPNQSGSYEIVAVQKGLHWKDRFGNNFGPNFCYSSRWLSRDLSTWQEDTNVRLEWAMDNKYGLSAIRYTDNRTAMMRFGTSPTGMHSSRARLSWWQDTAKPDINHALMISAILSHDSDMAWHPKWGAYLTWFSASSQPEHKPKGPFVIYGPDLEPWLKPVDLKQYPERSAPKFTPVIGGQAGSGFVQK